MSKNFFNCKLTIVECKRIVDVEIANLKTRSHINYFKNLNQILNLKFQT